MRIRGLVLGLVVAASIFGAAPAFAQSEASRAEARVLGERGVAELHAGHYAEALTMLEKAQALYPATTLVFYIAECKRHLGKLVEAQRLYAKIASEPPTADANAAFINVYDGARSALTEIRRTIPWITVRVHGADPSAVEVVIDGAPVPTAVLGHVEVDPGDHAIEAHGPAGVSARANVSVAIGKSETVDLNLASGAAPPPPPAPDTSKRSATPAIVAFGIGGAGLALGAITGAISLSDVSDIKSRCQPGGQCLTTDKSKGATAGTFATLSDVGFIVAGAGAAFGVTWLLWPQKHDDAAQPDVTARLGFGSASLAGRF